MHEMGTMLELANFHVALENVGISGINRELIARDIPGEYRNYMTSRVSGTRVVDIFSKRLDILDLLKEEEKRLKEVFGDDSVFDADEIIAVFVWDRNFGIISKEPTSVERWERFFRNYMEGDRKCIICFEEVNRVHRCSNCASVTCAECAEKSLTNECGNCMEKLDR